MSVTSGKGGVGKSHLAVNVAAVCAAGGKRVALIDADGGLANLDVLLGVQPQLHVGDLLDGASLDEVLFEARPNLALLPGAPGERRLAQLSDDDRRALQLAWTQVLERFDVVVVDVASGLSRDSLFFASAGEEPVLLVSDEPTSISDAAAVLQALQRDTSVSRVHVVVSAVRTTRSAQAVFGKLLSLVPDTRLRLRLAPFVPDDQNVRRAAMVRRPLVELAPHSPASRAFGKLAGWLLEPRGRPSGGPFLSEGQLEGESS